MTATVHSITRDTDVTRIEATAAHVRDDEPNQLAADLSDLLDAVAAAMRHRTDPPMTDAEMWRWSGVVGTARRISGRRL